MQLYIPHTRYTRAVHIIAGTPPQGKFGVIVAFMTDNDPTKPAAVVMWSWTFGFRAHLAINA